MGHVLRHTPTQSLCLLKNSVCLSGGLHDQSIRRETLAQAADGVASRPMVWGDLTWGRDDLVS